jgi:hypothetical protein
VAGLGDIGARGMVDDEGAGGAERVLEAGEGVREVSGVRPSAEEVRGAVDRG